MQIASTKDGIAIHLTFDEAAEIRTELLAVTAHAFNEAGSALYDGLDDILEEETNEDTVAQADGDTGPDADCYDPEDDPDFFYSKGTSYGSLATPGISSSWPDECDCDRCCGR